jgi:hypothetical protein
LQNTINSNGAQQWRDPPTPLRPSIHRLSAGINDIIRQRIRSQARIWPAWKHLNHEPRRKTISPTSQSGALSPLSAIMPDNAIPSSRISRSPPRSSSSPDSIFSTWRERLLSWWSYTSLSPFESYSQIPPSDLPLDQPTDQLPRREDDPKMELLRLDKARWRTYWLATVLCCGGALFGYDSGVIGTVLPILTEYNMLNIRFH